MSQEQQEPGATKLNKKASVQGNAHSVCRRTLEYASFSHTHTHAHTYTATPSKPGEARLSLACLLP